MSDLPLTSSHGHLPRLSPSAYRGKGVVHWTLTVHDRRQGWLDNAFHQSFRWNLLHGCARYDVACPVYCLMPDHVHLLVKGWTRQADQRLFIRFFRQVTEGVLKNGQAGQGPWRWQKQAYDHVLKPEESGRYAFESLAHYIASNPVRAGLVLKPGDWPFAGCVVPGYPELRLQDADYWPRFWRVVLSRSAD